MNEPGELVGVGGQNGATIAADKKQVFDIFQSSSFGPIAILQNHFCIECNLVIVAQDMAYSTVKQEARDSIVRSAGKFFI